VDHRGRAPARLRPLGDDPPGRRLGREWWGKGYATEAAAGIRDHARSRLGFDRLVSLIDPENAASKAVALRIGMQHERDLTFAGRPTSLFALQNRGQAPILQGSA